METDKMNKKTKLVEKIEEIKKTLKRLQKEDKTFPWKWDNLTFCSDGTPVVSECAYLGNTLIVLSDTYENSGEDCLFIQNVLEILPWLLACYDITQNKNS